MLIALIYSYAVLSTSEQQKLKNLAYNNQNTMEMKEAETRRDSKSFHKNWCLNLCDHAVKIICCRFTQTISPSDHDIIVLCEKSIFVVTTNGMIK